MRRLFALAVLALAATCAFAQGQGSGILYASDFNAWSLPQANTPTAGMIQWPSAAICRVASNGYSFVAVKVGRPLTIVDVNPAQIEIVIPTSVTTSGGSCSVTAPMIYTHMSYSVRSGTGGLQEAIDYSANIAGGSVVVLSPGWTVGGGTSAMITAATGQASTSILDQRVASLCAYNWNGSAYANTGCGVNGASLSAVTLQSFSGPISGPNVVGSTTPEDFGAFGDNTHDDTTAIQACWDYSAAHSIICRMAPTSGTYLVNGQLVIQSLMNVQGTGAPNGTIIRSEFNGDAIVIPAAPVQAVTLRDFELKLDPTLASQRGFHIQGVAGGVNSNGGLWDSHFINIEVDFCALECLWLDGGGDVGYAFNLPNQFIDLDHFNANGPAQLHPKALIRVSGQNAQIKFRNGQTNGDNNQTHYANPLVELNNKTSNLNDGPGDINFDTYTIQSGAKCLDTTWVFGATFNGSYLENCGTGITGADSTLSVVGSSFNNVGTGFNFAGSETATIADSTVNNSGITLTSFGTCTNANYVTMRGNNGGEALPTSGCVTVQQNIPVGGTLTVTSRNVLLNGDSGANPITNLVATQGAGEAVTLFANGQSFFLNSGVGTNISFGNCSTPYVVPAGSTVTLTLYDLGTTWQVQGCGAQPAGLPYYPTAGSTVNANFSLPAITTNGATVTVSGVGAISTSGITGGSVCAMTFKWTGTASQYRGSAFCETGGAYQVYHTPNANLSALSWIPQGITVGTAPPGVQSCVLGQFYANNTAVTDLSAYYYCDYTTLQFKQWPMLVWNDLTLTTTGTNCAAASYTAGTATLNVPACTPGGGGTVTSVAAPSGSWPTWLVPTVTNPTTTASLAVAASPIPNSALANAPTINSGTGPFTFNGTGVSCTGGTCTFSTGTATTPFPQHTYYIAAAGSDSNAGTFALPWLSPNHALNCGDVVIALPGTYTASNFASGKWGAVTCPNSNGVAWLQCQTFDTCKISAGATSGMIVSASFWGVQGWEITTTSAGGPCFATTPPTTAANIHHIVFANDVANGCANGGFSLYNNGVASIDYVAVVGSIAYNAAQGSTHCFSGISVYQPIPIDSGLGTHIYVGGNFSYGNLDPNPCNGTTPSDGNGAIFDTFDGVGAGGVNPTNVIYTQQAVMENNILVDNGGRAWEYQTYTKGSPAKPTVFILNNTGWGNATDANANYSICTDGSLNIGYGVLISKNIDMTTVLTACTGHTLSGMNIYDSSAANSAVTGNLVFTSSGTNISSFNDDGNTAPSTATNTTGTNPTFAAAANPSAPSCTGKLNVVDCMSTVISNFTPSATAALGLGYQTVSNGNGANPFFPQWLCRAGLPAGIVTKSCQ